MFNVYGYIKNELIHALAVKNVDCHTLWHLTGIYLFMPLKNSVIQ